MPTYFSNPDPIGELDKIRADRGTDRLKEVFHDLVRGDPDRALRMVNNSNAGFPSVYALRAEVKKSDLFGRLSTRNQDALKIVDDILSRDSEDVRRSSSSFRSDDYPTLKWILETGYRSDGLNDQYDEVMEATAILLIMVFHDNDSMRAVEEMIFNRYRRGALIYDLVWAFFECADMDNLKLVVNRLRSSEQKDVELARKLLNFIPCIGTDGEGEDPVRQYQLSLQWIEQNRNFLYYTGESSLHTVNPRRFAVSLEAKYLQKNAPDDYRNMPMSFTEEEDALLDGFRRMDDDSREALANYSALLYRKSRNWWRKWLQYPVEEQIKYAGRILGGLQ